MLSSTARLRSRVLTGQLNPTLTEQPVPPCCHCANRAAAAIKQNPPVLQTFGHPFGITVDPAECGHVYVADTAHHHVEVFSKELECAPPTLVLPLPWS